MAKNGREDLRLIMLAEDSFLLDEDASLTFMSSFLLFALLTQLLLTGIGTHVIRPVGLQLLTFFVLHLALGHQLELH